MELLKKILVALMCLLAFSSGALAADNMQKDDIELLDEYKGYMEEKKDTKAAMILDTLISRHESLSSNTLYRQMLESYADIDLGVAHTSSDIFIASYPKLYDGYFWKAMFYLKQKDRAKAVDYLEQAQKIAPKEWNVLSQLSLLYSLKKNELELAGFDKSAFQYYLKASKAAEAAVKLYNKDKSQIHSSPSMVFLVYAISGREEEALTLFPYNQNDKALNQLRAVFYGKVALAYYNDEYYERAKQYTGKGLIYAPTSKTLQALDAKISDKIAYNQSHGITDKEISDMVDEEYGWIYRNHYHGGASGKHKGRHR